MTVFTGEPGTAPPLQLRDGLVADLVRGFVEGPVPAEHREDSESDAIPLAPQPQLRCFEICAFNTSSDPGSIREDGMG